MKNFSVKLRGGQIVWPVLLILLLAVVGAICSGGCLAFMAQDGVDGYTAVGWPLVGGLALLLVVMLAVDVAAMLLSLRVLRTGLEAITYDGVAVETDYKPARLVGIVLSGVALTFITCGIYAPWFAARLMRYFADGATHKFNTISFRGKGMRLFAYVVLALVVPIAITTLVLGISVVELEQGGIDSFAPLIVLAVGLLSLLSIALVSVLVMMWSIDFGYGQKVVRCKMPLWQSMWFVAGQVVLIVLTLGLYAPMAELRIYRYVARRTYIIGDGGEEGRFGLVLHPWRDWAWVWVQIVLTIITLGIYTPWFLANYFSRFGSRLYRE